MYTYVEWTPVRLSFAAPNPVCPSDSGGRAGFVTKPYKKFRGTNAVTGFSSGLIAVKLSLKLILYQSPFAITEIDFVPGPFRYQWAGLQKADLACE